MKKKYTWRILGLVACLLFGLVTVSCHKEEEITEEQARIVMANAEVVMDNVSQIYEASETVEEMAQHLDEIKAMANVEDAYRDGIAICVKIKDGGIVMWCYYPEEEEDEKGVDVDELFKNINNNKASGKGGSVCEKKSICLLNAINRPWENGYEEVVTKCKKMLNWDTCIRESEQVTPDTILKYLPDNGVTILVTHGCYCDDQHWLTTGQLYNDVRVHLPKLVELWRKDLNRLVAYSGNVKVEDAKIMISETFLDLLITKKFPQNSIVYSAACQTFKGNNSLWLKLKSKGLGCMLGFDNTVYGSSAMNCCVAFMEEMIDGKTASEACETARRNVSISGPDGPVDLLCYPENSDIILVEKEPVGDDWVDLGLPSGLLWATRNVGATSPEDYGDYFAWGETATKNDYHSSTYIYYYNGNHTQITKYCDASDEGYNGFTDNLPILQPEDDAATANYGGRTPTWEEWQELMDNTTIHWTTRNGVNGILFTGTNGNRFFLPAAGSFYSSTLDDDGSEGFYWSSSLNLGLPYYAGGFHFDSSDQELYGGYSREYGFTVRAVRQN